MITPGKKNHLQVGSWSRWLSDFFGIDDDSVIEDQDSSENDLVHEGDAELKCFHLLNALSDLLMLPKDMLMDRSVRTEVCIDITHIYKIWLH